MLALTLSMLSYVRWTLVWASEDEGDDDGSNDDDDEEDEDASSSSFVEMTASQWLALYHSWQKGEVVLGMRVVTYLGGELA